MDRRNFIQSSAPAVLAAGTATSLSEAKSGSDPKYFDIVLAVVDAWRRLDIDGVLVHISEDILWYSHVGSPPMQNKPQMRAFLETFASGITDVKWVIYNHAISGNQIFLDGADDFVMIPEKRRVAIPYLGVMTFRGALICEWRDYFDRAVFLRYKAGEVPTMDMQRLLDRPGRP